MIGEFRLSQLATELGVPAPRVDTAFTRVTTDSRSVQPGDLYIALVGERFDGNDFAADCLAEGACGVVVSRRLETDGSPCLLVPDTLAALAAVARLNRRRSQSVVVALTGSQGKTSVKEMLGSIMARAGATLVTHANLNNNIGVPLTLLDIDEGHDYAVIEMGANGAGEIAFSVAAALPDIALITKASAAHLEGFGSLQGIVEAKGEIIDGLSADGVAVLNANDPNCAQWVARAGGRRVRMFSYGGRVAAADYRCSEPRLLENGSQAFCLITPQGECEVQMSLLGNHSAENALSAAACALEAGLSLDAVREGLAQAQPVPGRLFPSIGRAGCRLLDDTYNASPDSYRAAIDVLMSAAGDQVLVAGGMRELGAETDAAHREVGAYAAKRGVPLLLAQGEECRQLLESYLEAGGRAAKLFDEQAALARECQELASSGHVFLIKGSRGTRMDRIVSDLLDNDY